MTSLNFYKYIFSWVLCQVTTGIYSFNKNILGIYSVPDIESKGTTINKIDNFSYPCVIYILAWWGSCWRKNIINMNMNMLYTRSALEKDKSG